MKEAAQTAPAAAEGAPTELPQTDANPLLESLRKEVNDYKEGWLRERADFNNYKKRTESQMRELRETAAIDTLLALLPIIDDFELAMTSVPEELKDHPWLNGVGGIHRKFARVLEEKGVTFIDPVGQPFDPNRHEAIVMEDSETVDSGHVIATLQKGYARGERVLRPARVKVAN